MWSFSIRRCSSAILHTLPHTDSDLQASIYRYKQASVLTAQLLFALQRLHIKNQHLEHTTLLYDKNKHQGSVALVKLNTMTWECFALIYGQSVFSVSDAVALQNEWTFARANRLATSLFRKVKAFFLSSG